MPESAMECEVMPKKRTDTAAKAESEDLQEEVHYHYHHGTKEERPRQRYEEKRTSNGGKEIHHHYYYEPPAVTGERSSKPGIAGSLLIITAILGFITATVMFGGMMFMSDSGSFMDFIGSFDDADVYGTITYENGTPARNVTVTIAKENLNTTTDENGNYRLFDVPIGNQELEIELEGYNTIIKRIFVDSNNSGGGDFSDITQTESNEHNFVLEPGTEVVERGSYPDFDWISQVLGVCAVINIILSIIVLLAGYMAIKRRNFPFVIIGAIIGIFTIGFAVGSILSIIAVFILLLSKNEFRKN
jgi:hypothetical protein